MICIYVLPTQALGCAKYAKHSGDFGQKCIWNIFSIEFNLEIILKNKTKQLKQLKTKQLCETILNKGILYATNWNFGCLIINKSTTT